MWGFKPPSFIPRALATVSESPGLWFERVYTYLRLPFWAGILLVSIGPYLAGSLLTLYFLAPAESVLVEEAVGYVAYFVVFTIWIQYAARAARRGVENVEKTTEPMRQGRPLDLQLLYSPGMAFLFFVLIEIVTLPLFLPQVFGEELTGTQSLILLGLTLYGELFHYTFFWVLVYSLYAIYRIGQLELKLKHFSEDRSLGLSPLGRLALKLAGFYVLFLAFNIVPDALSAFLTLPVLSLYVVVIILAFPLFFLPLLPLRRRLRREKSELLGRLAPRFARLYREIEANPEGEIRREDANELLVLQGMRRDIEEIHTWPFDTAVVVRLSVIVFSVTAIILSRIIGSFLGV